MEERLDAYALDPRAFFKFVIAEPGVEEVLALQRKHAIPPARIFLMPEGPRFATARNGWSRYASNTVFA